jgi:hypothetical protein
LELRSNSSGVRCPGGAGSQVELDSVCGAIVNVVMKRAPASRFKRRAAVTLVAGLMLLPCLALPAEIAAKTGQTVAFLGDAITQFGWQNQRGFVRLVVAGLETNKVKVTPVAAGVIGDNSDRMLARLKSDVLDKKPDWVVLSCGLIDSQPGTNSVPLARFGSNIIAIVERCQASGSQLLILTTTIAGEDLNNAANLRLAGYNVALRTAATDKKCLLADLNTMFQEVIRSSERPVGLLTVGGTYMNALGDQLVAKGILQAFGLTDAEEEKAEQAWFELFKEAPPLPPTKSGKS